MNNAQKNSYVLFYFELRNDDPPRYAVTSVKSSPTGWFNVDLIVSHRNSFADAFTRFKEEAQKRNLRGYFQSLDLDTLPMFLDNGTETIFLDGVPTPEISLANV